MLRISPDLHQRLRKRADKEGRSLNSLCSEILSFAAGDIKLLATAPTARTMEPIFAPVIKNIIDTFKQDLLGLVLFGSEARGSSFPNSDIDLLLVIDPSRKINRALYREWEAKVAPLARQHLDKELSPHFVSVPDNAEDAGSIWLEVSIDGKVIWEKDHDVSSILRTIRTGIASGNIRRETTHGHHYWIKE